ncbi:MATE family multidrug resistance protein [Hephaestia caeni]|uniref:MATE family multidrug resistance protein n=1 Tax=Hephaestia caeni TaxID=645617 RepID=A0A397P4F3_9SPHN|nr:MATE family efflux transporter [Hephaestia caeni]RIA44430.1 MATE family multidrug resistance protein [Hephaestia caeni]
MPDRRFLTAETRRILALAWPVVLTSLNWTILHVTDIVVVGLVSTEQVAALGASRTLTFILIVAALGAMSGVLVFVARADGAGDLGRTGRVLREGLVLGLGFGVAAGLVLFGFASELLAAVGVAPALVPDAARVVRVMAFGFPFQLVIVAASYFLEGISRPRRVMVVNLGVLPFNALLAWILADGLLGFPRMGAVGAATATVLASALGAVAMLVAVWTLRHADARGVHDLGRAAWAGVGRGALALARFGLVPAIASALELAGFSILIALSTQLGDATAHAFQIVFSVHNVTFGLALGLGSAAGVRTGNAVGEGHPGAAIPRAGIAIGLAGAAMTVLAALLVLASPLIVAGFPATGEVHALAAAMLPVWAPFIIFDGLQIVLVYTLRSLGDQVVAGINSIIAYFLVTGGLGWALVDHGVGPMGLVYASGTGMLVAALLNGSRFWRLSRRFHRQS